MGKMKSLQRESGRIHIFSSKYHPYINCSFCNIVALDSEFIFFPWVFQNSRSVKLNLDSDSLLVPIRCAIYQLCYCMLNNQPVGPNLFVIGSFDKKWCNTKPSHWLNNGNQALLFFMLTTPPYWHILIDTCAMAVVNFVFHECRQVPSCWMSSFNAFTMFVLIFNLLLLL